jgi:hypothetical protein
VDNKISYFSYNVALRLGNYHFFGLFYDNFKVSDVWLEMRYGLDDRDDSVTYLGKDVLGTMG